MRTDSPTTLMGALGMIEDEMAHMQVEYAEAAGWMAWWEHWHRREYLKMREVLKSRGEWPAGTTETQKKDDVEQALQVAFPREYAELAERARQKAIGDKLFQALDARRSIGQTLMKPHLAADPQYGQGARGQVGVGA